METLFFGAGTLLGVFLGMLVISLLSLAQKGDKFLDLINRGGQIATLEDICWLDASETRLPTGSGEARPQRDLVDRGQRAAQ